MAVCDRISYSVLGLSSFGLCVLPHIIPHIIPHPRLNLWLFAIGSPVIPMIFSIPLLATLFTPDNSFSRAVFVFAPSFLYGMCRSPHLAVWTKGEIRLCCTGIGGMIIHIGGPPTATGHASGVLPTPPGAILNLKNYTTNSTSGLIVIIQFAIIPKPIFRLPSTRFLTNIIRLIRAFGT